MLYLLAVGGVRGFAFTLGLTTLIDLIVVILFTHPVVALLARRRFFATGHRLSGFDAEHLGRTVAYAGRGRVREPAPTTAGRGKVQRAEGDGDVPEPGRQTIAERKRAAERAADPVASAVDPDAADGTQDPTVRSSAAKES